MYLNILNGYFIFDCAWNVCLTHSSFNINQKLAPWQMSMKHNWIQCNPEGLYTPDMFLTFFSFLNCWLGVNAFTQNVKITLRKVILKVIFSQLSHCEQTSTSCWLVSFLGYFCLAYGLVHSLIDQLSLVIMFSISVYVLVCLLCSSGKCPCVH